MSSFEDYYPWAFMFIKLSCNCNFKIAKNRMMGKFQKEGTLIRFTQVK